MRQLPSFRDGDLLQVWELAEFRAGLWFGLGGAAFALLMFALGSAYRDRLASIGGVMLAGSALLAVASALPVPMAVPIAMAGMAGSAACVHALRLDPMLALVGAAPFGWLLGWHTGVVDIAWVRFLVAVTAVGGGYLAGRLDETWRSEAVGLPMFLLSVAGVYFTVPDTEATASILGVALVFSAFGWPLRWLVLGRTGSAALVCLLTWSIAIDSRARLSSMIAAVMCLGLLVAVPAGVVLAPRVVRRKGSSDMLVVGLLAVHALLVFVAAKYGGDDGDAHTAMGVGIGFGLVALALGLGFRAPEQVAAVAAPTTRVERAEVTPASSRWAFNSETNRWVRTRVSGGSGSR